MIFRLVYFINYDLLIIINKNQFISIIKYFTKNNMQLYFIILYNYLNMDIKKHVYYKEMKSFRV